MSNAQSDEQFTDEEIARRAEAALLRALSTPHKKQSEMKLGKRKRSVHGQGANQERNVSGASHLADAPASQEASKP